MVIMSEMQPVESVSVADHCSTHRGRAAFEIQNSKIQRGGAEQQQLK